MVEIPVKIDPPLSRENVLSLNQKRVRGPLDRRSVSELNRPAPGGSGDRPYAPTPQPYTPAPQPYTPAPQPYAPTPQPYTPAPQPQPAAQTPPQAELPPLLKPARKGQKLPLEAGGKLRKLEVCFGWNVSSAACEVDASAFLLRNGQVLGDEWFVFYGQESSPDGSTAFSAQAGPDRQRITVDFQRLNPAVDRIAFILTINEALEKNLNFSMIRDAYVRLIDGVSREELVSFRIEEYYPNVVSMTIGEVYLHNGAWKFSAVGNGVGKDLAGLCQLYGVQIE